MDLRKDACRGLLVIGLLVTACAPATVEQAEPSPEPVRLKLVLEPYLSFAPLFIAEEEGYFTEQGLQTEFVRMNRSSEAIPALLQGELDVLGGTISIGLLNAMARDARIKFVADRGYIASTGCAYNALLARRELVEAGELENLAQLRGQSIALNPISFSGYFVEKLFDTADLTLDDVKTEDIPNPVKLEGLEKGTIAAAAAAEPWITRMLQGGHAVLWMPAQQAIPDGQSGFVMYGPTFLDENPNAGERFMIAYLKAVKQYNQGKTERNLEIVAEYTGLDQGFLAEACWPSIHDDGQINVQSVLDFQAWAAEKGYLDSPVTEEQFWDPSFVEYANEVLGAPSE